MAWGERMLALAQAIGARRDAALAHHRMARAAEGRGDVLSAIRWQDEAAAGLRAVGDRRVEAVALRHLGSLQLGRGDLQAAWQALDQAQALQQGLDETIEALELGAWVALCTLRLGRAADACAAVDRLLQGLDGEGAGGPAHETLATRWVCQQVLEALGDARAAPLLDALHAAVQARATELTGADDRPRLLQALPDCRDIVAAWARRGLPPG
jgi:tetratricopeptide (TPR) repeat protein